MQHNLSDPKYNRNLLRPLRPFTCFLLFLLITSGCTLDDTSDLIDDRDAFLGDWNVIESCSKDAYAVQIVKDPSNSAQVLIHNFWNTGSCDDPVYALVAGSSIYITKQKFCNADFEGEGDGDLYKEIIEWSYSISDGADLFNCNASYSRPWSGFWSRSSSSSWSSSTCSVTVLIILSCVIASA